MRVLPMSEISDVLNQHPVTQTWDEHIENAGPKLGGVDWDMPMYTYLPAPPGTVRVESGGPWYNSGLGLARRFIRADGYSTVYGHGSSFTSGLFYSGNSGKSTAPHVHIHDLEKDGVTRRPPFSQLASTDTELIGEESDMDKLTILIETQQDKNETAGHWWVVNYYEHKYYHVETMDTVNFLRQMGIREISRATGNGFQSTSIFKGFTEV